MTLNNPELCLLAYEPRQPKNLGRKILIGSTIAYAAWAILVVVLWIYRPHSETANLLRMSDALTSGGLWQQVGMANPTYSYSQVWAEISRTAILRIVIPGVVLAIGWFYPRIVGSHKSVSPVLGPVSA